MDTKHFIICDLVALILQQPNWSRGEGGSGGSGERTTAWLYHSLVLLVFFCLHFIWFAGLWNCRLDSVQRLFQCEQSFGSIHWQFCANKRSIQMFLWHITHRFSFFFNFFILLLSSFAFRAAFFSVQIEPVEQPTHGNWLRKNHLEFAILQRSWNAKSTA